jgi:WhiB family redox-sensing transcriptional regulator
MYVVSRTSTGIGRDGLSWFERARCRGASNSVFYPQRGVPSASALAMCRSCEVRVECLEYALENDEEFGIWGGLSERERRKLKSDRERMSAVVRTRFS